MTALIFDCDGVLADTERYGHLPAFNQMFEEFGLPVRWSEEEYGEKLAIGGGKERMMSLLTDEFVRDAGLPADPEGQKAAVADWHRRKTEIYTEMVAAGRLPGRPGVARIVAEALDAGWDLAVASTSAEASVRAVLEHVVGADRRGAVRLVLRRRRGRPRRSPPPTSTSWRWSGSAWRRDAGARDRGLPQRAARGGRRRPDAASSRCSSYTERRGLLRGGAGRVVPRRPGRGAHEGAGQPQASPSPDGYVALGDLQACLAAGACPADERSRRCGWRTRALRASSWSCGRSRRPRSTTRSTSAIWTRSWATATSGTRWRAASRWCWPTWMASTATTSGRS